MTGVQTCALPISENCDKLLLLGDILYHGPRNGVPPLYDPKEVIDMLNSIKEKIVCVRGNCDTEVDQMVLEFPMMAEYALLYHDRHLIFATHGHHHNEQNPPHLYRGDILLNGHTHIPALNVYDNFTYINPGSVSLPKGDSVKSYIVFEDGLFLWKNLKGETYKEYKMI